MKASSCRAALRRVSSFFGVWSCVCIALFVLLVGISVLSAGSIAGTEEQALVETSHQQLLITQRLASNTQSIELSILTEDWPGVESAMESIAEDHTLWNQNQETLIASAANSFRETPATETIGGHFGRIGAQYTSMNHALDRIEVVGQSVIRRAPYIDASTLGRIQNARAELQRDEAVYSMAMEEIVRLYVLNAQQSSSQALARARRSSMMILGAFLLLLLSGIVPRLRARNAQITRLHAINDETRAEVTHRWDRLKALGSSIHKPVQTIVGSATILQNDEPDRATNQEHAGRILDAGSELIGLFEDILESSSNKPVARLALGNTRVLLIEDCPDTQRLLTHHLTNAGCTVQVAGNGQVGVDLCAGAGESDEMYDLILMDMQLPVLDGIEATAVLREDGVNTPILGVSAMDGEGDRERFLNAGCDELLAKPVQPGELIEMCVNLLKNQDHCDTGLKKAA